MAIGRLADPGTGLAGGADVILIPESLTPWNPSPSDRATRPRGSNFSIVAVAEGARNPKRRGVSGGGGPEAGSLESGEIQAAVAAWCREATHAGNTCGWPASSRRSPGSNRGSPSWATCSARYAVAADRLLATRLEAPARTDPRGRVRVMAGAREGRSLCRSTGGRQAQAGPTDSPWVLGAPRGTAWAIESTGTPTIRA